MKISIQRKDIFASPEAIEIGYRQRNTAQGLVGGAIDPERYGSWNHEQFTGEV